MLSLLRSWLSRDAGQRVLDSLGEGPAEGKRPARCTAGTSGFRNLLPASVFKPRRGPGMMAQVACLVE